MNTTPKKIKNKYDLMHLNTPMYAYTEITWDTSRLSKITKNRVLNALQSGFTKYHRGDAAAMYKAIAERFGIPRIKISNARRKETHTEYGELRFHHVNDKVYQELSKVYKAEQVMRRLSGETYIPWYLASPELPREASFFYLENEHNLADLELVIKEMFEGQEYADKVKNAIQFIENGGTFKFTYDPTDR